MLDERLGVPVPLEDDAFGLIVVEVNVILQRASVLGPRDLHGLSGQALELLDLALVKLGIDRASAAKIEEIKRLRPLTVNQPWGVFFVKFEPKRLPVVALRRILSSV